MGKWILSRAERRAIKDSVALVTAHNGGKTVIQGGRRYTDDMETHKLREFAQSTAPKESSK